MRFRWQDIVNPMMVAFPIFWFPVIIPFLVNGLGALVFDLAPFGHIQPPGIDASTMGSGIGVVLLKTINLSLISTDVWALTTVISYIARKRVDPSRTVALM